MGFGIKLFLRFRVVSSQKCQHCFKILRLYEISHFGGSIDLFYSSSDKKPSLDLDDEKSEVGN